MREAAFYTREGEVVTCGLCPRRCRLKEGARGFCRVRRNLEGRLYATSYAECTSFAVDPTEKKPLYHFYPGSTLLSLGTVRCNLACAFCQNWTISQADAPTQTVEPREAVAMAVSQRRRDPSCVGLAFTYSEPTIWFEYVMDTARLARTQGLKNVLVTNGYINPEPLEQLLKVVDAMNIDVKAFTAEFYRNLCHGELEPVLDTVARAKSAGCHVEVTNLLIPGLNDSPEEVEALTDWLGSLGREIPLHFSRYFPHHRLALEPTPVETLERARSQAKKKLYYVYVGNVWGGRGSDTHCYRCGALVIRRSGFTVRAVGLKPPEPARGEGPAQGEKATQGDGPARGEGPAEDALPACAACGAPIHIVGRAMAGG
ncbi:MAG: AmmeMemoRadiSam system radical SAM enzyme [Acetobacteraceae bacterium]|nr:AmmeMemoRadiSam system radical SAM enzyme [Acetobacteraceae bacterium]